MKAFEWNYDLAIKIAVCIAMLTSLFG